MLCIRSIWGMRRTHWIHSLFHSQSQSTRFCYAIFSLAVHDALIYISLWDFAIRIFWCQGICDVVFGFLSIFCFSRGSYSKVVKHIRTEGIRANTLIDQSESEICFIALSNQRIFADHIRGKRMMMMNKQKMKRKKLLMKKVSTFASDKKKVLQIVFGMRLIWIQH